MFWNIFYKLCEEKHTKPNAVAKIIGASSATCTKWKNGTIPNGDTLLKLADYLGVSVDYLLGRADSPEINNQTISDNATITTGNINGNNNNSISNTNTTVNGTQCNHMEPAEKSADNLDETAEQVAKAFQSLNIMNKAKVLTLLAQLTESEKTA